MTRGGAFVDQIRIFVRAGNGGAGSRHFRRTRRNAKGGPDGGNGGRGGDVILEGKRDQYQLLPFRYRKHVIAPHGAPGSSNYRQGADGADTIWPVPLGTVIRWEGTSNAHQEITQHGERLVVACGGRGGWGNAHFRSASNRAPQYAQPGAKGARYPLILELKLMADVGLVGAPNAGKSTLLTLLSTAQPKVAPYAFTTLVPHVGRVIGEGSSFTVADIPGLIPGAATGRGLGLRFLRHIERTNVLLFLIPIDTTDIMGHYAMLRRELHAHQPALLDKSSLLAITQIDRVQGAFLAEQLASIPQDCRHLAISSTRGDGIQQLKEQLSALVQHPKQ